MNPRRKRGRVAKLTPPSAAWNEFAASLAAALTDLGHLEMLVISREGTDYFVQFAGHAFEGLRLEAVSNAYLSPYFQLPETSTAQLLALGWSLPTYVQADHLIEPSTGSPNFYIDVGFPLDHRKLARLAIRTLRDVHNAIDPSELVYRAWSADCSSIRFGQLGIRRLDIADYFCERILSDVGVELVPSVQLPAMMPAEVS